MHLRVKTLDLLPRGSRGEVLAVDNGCSRANCLRRMGLREGSIVEVMSSHDPVLLRCDGCMLAVNREVLSSVTICRCGCEKEEAAAQHKTQDSHQRVEPRVDQHHA
ncbi:MAG: FeoA family protein [Phycisphaerales bacterium]